MEQVILISLLSGIATGLGGLIVIWFGTPTSKVLAFYLGISAGMMGMVVIADLLPASLQYGSFSLSIFGFLLGILLMYSFDIIIKGFFTTQHDSKVKTNQKSYKGLGYFMTFAIALHNLPEGLAIGAGFQSQEELGIRIALVIALHNIPEGLGVASTLYLGKSSKVLVFLLPLATGFFIPIGTLIGGIIGHFVTGWISIGLSLAGGAMGYLVIKDIGPESIRLNRLLGQFGMFIGILILYIVYKING